MGFYDGAGGVTTAASSYELAKVTDTPVILVVNARGMSLSVVSLIQGFLGFRPDSKIAGVILNQVSASSYPMLKHCRYRYSVMYPDVRNWHWRAAIWALSCPRKWRDFRKN